MEYMLRKIPNDYAYKRNYLDKYSNNIQVIFFGNSHIYYGIDPELISKNSFNASHVSQSIDYDSKIFFKYANEWDSLEFIVLNISYSSLFSKISEEESSKWRIKNYIIYYYLYKDFNFRNFTELFSLPFKSSITRIKKYFITNKNEITCSKKGYGINQRKKKDLVISGKSAAKRHTKSDFAALNDNVLLIEELISHAKKNGIKVILLTPPAYRTYSNSLNSTQLILSIKTAQNLANKHVNCDYYNFLTDVIFFSEDFRDADHLDSKGAIKFSNLINQLIK